MRAPVAIVLSVGAALLWPAATVADSSPPPIVRPAGAAKLSGRDLGSQLFAANCASCHGSRGGGVWATDPQAGASGVKGIGPSLRGVGARAADFYLTTGYMPIGRPREQPARSKPSFDAREIRALTDYVASLAPGAPIPHPSTEGDVAKGQQSFTESCAGCHQVVGEGGVVTGAKVPPLDVATPRQIAEAVRIGPYVMPAFSKKAISDRELDDIVTYVRYAQRPRDVGGWSINHLGPFPEGLIAWFMAMVVLVGVCVAIGSRVRRA